jgi:hypothetical protein
LYDQLILKYQIEKKYQKVKLPLSTLLVDIYGDTISMSMALQGNTKYIFRYTELNCQSCVDEEILRLKRINFSKNELVIITYYNSIRSLIYFIKESGVDFRIYSVIDNNFIHDLDILNLPYYIKISDDYSIQDVFLVNRNEKLIEDYFVNIDNAKKD